MLTNNAHIYDSETGYFVSQKHQDIAEIIHDWNPQVHLVWIPPDKRTEKEDREFPFAVIHHQNDGQQYVIFKIRENELDERVLARLWASDNSKNNILSEIEAQEAARNAVKLKRQMEEMEEAKELAASIAKSPLSRYKHNGITYRD